MKLELSSLSELVEYINDLPMAVPEDILGILAKDASIKEQHAVNMHRRLVVASQLTSPALSPRRRITGKRSLGHVNEASRGQSLRRPSIVPVLPGTNSTSAPEVAAREQPRGAGLATSKRGLKRRSSAIQGGEDIEQEKDEGIEANDETETDTLLPGVPAAAVLVATGMRMAVMSAR
jgi:hypothetical protein